MDARQKIVERTARFLEEHGVPASGRPESVESPPPEADAEREELESFPCYSVLMGSRHAFRLELWLTARDCRTVPYASLEDFAYTRGEDASQIVLEHRRGYRIVLTGRHLDLFHRQLRDEKVVRIVPSGDASGFFPEGTPVIESIEIVEPEMK